MERQGGSCDDTHAGNGYQSSAHIASLYDGHQIAINAEELCFDLPQLLDKIS